MANLFTPWKAPAITLRPYQREAVDAVYQHLRTRDDNPCVVIPTGGGKTPVIAQICSDAVNKWRGRVCILAPTKELLEQAAEKLDAFRLPYGLYSAGLNRRDTSQPVIVAGIQSIYERACEFGRFDIIIPDEAHGIPPDGEGRYRTFLADARVVNPNVKIVGMTATPYRMASGEICTPDGILNHVCYEIGVKELIVNGHLSPLVSKNGKTRVDRSQLHIRGGEFIASEVESLFNDDPIVRSACEEIVGYTHDRKACLIFAAGVDHGLHVRNVLESQFGQSVGFIEGNLSPEARRRILNSFSEGRTKYLVNVNVLTTGYDAPHIDCVALLRSTNSPGLYYQMCGRGFRLFPGKTDCLVLDFGGNVECHGPVDQLEATRKKRREGTDEAPAKECPQCQAVIAAGYGRCPQCGYEFPPPESSRHGETASEAGVLSGQITTTKHEVQSVNYSVHVKRGNPDAPRSMRVDYEIAVGEFKSEWICFEHSGFARQKACAWWKKRSHDPIPKTAEEAVQATKSGALAETFEITVRSVAGEDFERIIDYVLGDKPEPLNSRDQRTLPTLTVFEARAASSESFGPPPAVLIEHDDGTQTRYATLKEYDEAEIPF